MSDFGLDSNEVLVAVTGGIFVDLAGNEVLPSDGTSSLAAWDELGYATDAGIVQAIQSQLSDIQAWQNADVVRKVQTSHDVTYATALMQTNAKTAETYYGDYDPALKRSRLTGKMLPVRKWVFDVFDGPQKIRVVVPRGQITDRGDVSYVSANAITYPVTITAYPDDNGVKAYIYFVEIGES